MKRAFVAMVMASTLLFCSSEESNNPAPQTDPNVRPKDPVALPPEPPVTREVALYVSFGSDVSNVVRARTLELLQSTTDKKIIDIPSSESPGALGAGSWFFGFGDTEGGKRVLPASDVESLTSEGYVIRSKAIDGVTYVAARGVKRGSLAFGNLGTHHAVYAALEQLGFGFLHPLKPAIPSGLPVTFPELSIRETPRWDERTIHLHTQHPLELTDFLQGWGPLGPTDKAGFEAQIPEWDRFLEWCVANQQNSVEWFLLWADSWGEFADSDERMARLKKLVDRAHDYGIAAGIDVPIAFAQQHSFRLLRKQGELADELVEIRKNLGNVMKAKFDFLGTEAGTSEFTHPKPERMLAWMNELTRLAEDEYKVHVFIKIHCSTSQVAEGYKDPKTGADINFNFLPHFADKRLGVLPHTVQHYGLTDPAPTYGNTNFNYIREFLQQEADIRPTVFYPETAYWVSFDVDVPLFLPIYAERRVSDLRMLDLDEKQKRAGASGKPMTGQLIFSSGWEWGYWLNDAVAARAAWNPHAEASSDSAAYSATLASVLRPFGALSGELNRWLTDYAAAEYKYLIHGEINGKRPGNILQRSGQAYMQGWETWDDVSKTSESLPVKLPNTQPDKLGLVDMRNPARGGPKYTGEIDLLLTEMETTFLTLDRRIQDLVAQANPATKDLVEEFRDAARMTYLRARQVHGLYDYVDDFFNLADRETRKRRLAEARAALDEATTVVARRENSYRVPVRRIAGWRKNPTAYSYGYLWTVHSLHYFWRDEGKAVDAPAQPCYMNIVNPVDVANGEGIGTDAARFFGSVLSSNDRRGCLAEPESEPMYPQDNLRSRP
jgi:hypothetical protein